MINSCHSVFDFSFLLNKSALSEICTLSLHDALPICKALSTMREVADRIVDTSALTVHQLKDLLIEAYVAPGQRTGLDRKSTRLNSSHGYISYAVFCLKKKINTII